MNMFRPTAAKKPEEYIAMIEDDQRREEVEKLHDFIREVVPELEPCIESGMIGYGKMPYKTKSGREGEWPVLMLASRKNYIAVYASTTQDGQYIAEKYKDKIGKSDVGRSCMRFKQYKDINLDGLREVLKESVEVAKKSGLFT